ncbi:MAG: protein translocase subunit SecD [Kiritimatiellae bacterium]|nr:protein translocase subunit SecD [Kiritimatiellia bacterium]
MSRNDLWKWLVLAIAALLSVYAVYPFKEKIRLGLDLSGGTSFVLAVDREKLENSIRDADNNMTKEEVDNKVNSILKDADSRAIEVIRNRIDGLGVNEPVIQGGKNHRITVQLPGISSEARMAAEQSLQSAAFLEFKVVYAKNDAQVDKVFASGKAPEGYELAEDGRSFKRAANFQEVSRDPEYARRLSLFMVPGPQYAFMLQKETRNNGDVVYVPVYVLRKSELTGNSLSSASVETDPMTGKIEVNLTLNAKGAAEFARVTKDLKPRGKRNKDSEIGRRLAIILDDTLYSAPTINEEIPNGRARITGSFSYAEASLLRNVLNAGSLPAPMKILQKSSVESTLGEDAIKSGIFASLLAMALVAVFMLVYYTYCGLIADIALALDLFLLPVGLLIASNIMAVFVRDAAVAKNSLDLPVLTMPGIAGIVLTLGMAVDANVLIFERIREEFAQGKSARTAISAGYGRAFLAIFDSNVTTILTGVVLFIVGVGPIRGFAITLCAGIIVSMFTALVVTRLIFNATVPEGRSKPYKMLQLVKNPKIDFIKLGKPAMIASLVVTVLTLGLFFTRAFTNPPSVLAVDFTGGAAVTFNYDQEKKADLGEIRKVVTAIDSGASLQYQSSLEGKGQLLQVKTSFLERDGKQISGVILEELNKAIPDSKFQIANEESVGSEVGSDLKRSAVKAVIFSLIGILIYVGIRFEFGFGLGGVVALAHDALITLGLYSLFGRQMSLTTVAALLTIVGYSINDTIVIFDRVRETLKSDHTTDFKELCNQALNSTLSRTLLTSITTLLAVLVLFLFGGGAINDFALAMLIGVIAGTYSSLFIATPIMLWWFRGHRPKFAVSKE